MWEQYEEAHGHEIYADEMGYQIESQNCHIHNQLTGHHRQLSYKNQQRWSMRLAKR